MLSGHRVNVESLILLEARPYAGETDEEIVAGAWDFAEINRRYAIGYKTEVGNQSGIGHKPGDPLAMPDSMPVDRILADLESTDSKIRRSCLDALHALGIRGPSEEDGKKLLAAAAGNFPQVSAEAPRPEGALPSLNEVFERARSGELSPDEAGAMAEQAALAMGEESEKYGGADISLRLIEIAGKEPWAGYAPVIAQHFSDYSADARFFALELLAKILDRIGAETFVRLSQAFASELEHIPWYPLRDDPRHADVFFPSMLDLLAHKKLRGEVCEMLFHYCEAGLLKPVELAPYADRLLSLYTGLRDRIEATQRAHPLSWMWDDKAYVEIRGEAELLLDLFGWLPTESSRHELRRAVRLSDPCLKGYAAIALLRLGETVSPRELSPVGASPEMRNRLYKALEKLERLELFPDEFRNQLAFAESDMVEWLAFPTELQRPPDEIELMKSVTVDAPEPDGSIEYYVFRFRVNDPHWAADSGWMAGIAGPYRVKEKPTPNGLGETFSQFEPADEWSAEEHVRRRQDECESPFPRPCSDNWLGEI